MLSEVQENSSRKRTWVNLTFRTGAAWLGVLYFNRLLSDPAQYPAARATVEIMSLGAHAVAGVFTTVLVIEICKMLASYVDAVTSVRRGAELYESACTNTQAKEVLHDRLASGNYRWAYREDGGNDAQRGRAVADHCEKVGAMHEVPDPETARRSFIFDRTLVQYMRLRSQGLCTLDGRLAAFGTRENS